MCFFFGLLLPCISDFCKESESVPWSRAMKRARILILMLWEARGHERCSSVQRSSWEVWGVTGALVSGIMWITAATARGANAHRQD